MEILLSQREPEVLLETAEQNASLLDQWRLVRPAVDLHLVPAGLAPLLRDEARAHVADVVAVVVAVVVASAKVDARALLLGGLGSVRALRRRGPPREAAAEQAGHEEHALLRHPHCAAEKLRQLQQDPQNGRES